MRGTALALLALVATAQEARSVPTRFLEGALGSPAVRPPSLAPTRPFVSDSRVALHLF